LLAADMVFFFGIHPSTLGIIILFIFINATFVWVVTTYFLRKKNQAFVTVFIALFLGLNYFIGFDILNTLLLLSFIIGVGKLL